jgi:hypothetical protein
VDSHFSGKNVPRIHITGFKTCHLSNALDGNKDDAIWLDCYEESSTGNGNDENIDSDDEFEWQ